MCCCLNNVDQPLPRLKSHAAADRSATLQRPCQHPLQVIRSSTGHVQASTLRNQPEKTPNSPAEVCLGARHQPR